MAKEVFWCSSCLNMSTRPRITFDHEGRCNACQWSDEKKTFNWKEREEELKKNLKKYTNASDNYKVIVPVSGGKDGSYICLLYTSPSPRDTNPSRMPSSA